MKKDDDAKTITLLSDYVRQNLELLGSQDHHVIVSQ